MAAQIDRQIAARWAAEHVEPAPTADDAEFLRRTFLNIAGRIPAAAEVELFLEDKHADKRRKVVDDLLESPGYPTHFADLLRSAIVPEANTDLQLAFQAGPFGQWLRRRLAENVGYNRLAKDLMTASVGTAGPGFYFTAKGGKPENIASGVARVFLGVRIECAQCHNHPFAKWRREQFWKFAAFFAGINRDTNGQIRENPQLAELKIPDSSNVVKARYLDDASPALGSVSPRQTLAEWIVSDRNPYFAQAAVNRIWAHFFGTGIVDPIDDFDESNPPSHPELLDSLARAFVREKYDLKFLIRAICATRAYQSSSLQTAPGQGNRRLFARAAVKGLAPAELVQSLAQAVGDYDGMEETQAVLSAFYRNGSPLRSMVMSHFKNEANDGVDWEATILQALALMNSGAIDQSTTPSRGNTLRAVLDAPFLDTPGRIEMLYLATLSRRPTRSESRKLVKFVESGGTHSASKPKMGNVFQRLISTDTAKGRGDKEIALGDVFWALLNSSEFLTNH